MIGIITLNWDTSGLLIKLIESIKKFTYNPFYMVIVDNGSKLNDYKTVESYVKDDQRFILIRNEVNTGFPKGNNQAIPYLIKKDVEPIFFINSDIEIKQDSWDKTFIEFFNTKECISILGAGLFPIFWDKDANFHLVKNANRYMECETVQGSFFAIRKNVIESLIEKYGYLFDERFSPAYHEETEMMMRAKLNHFHSAWIPVDHFHDSGHSATKQHAYKINSEFSDFKGYNELKERNRKLLLEIRSDYFNESKPDNVIYLNTRK